MMIALAGTGIAFGHWYDSAYVNVQVNTGYIDVQLDSTGLPTITGQCPNCPGTVTAVQLVYSGGLLQVPPNALGTVYGDTLLLNITNAYPGICVNGIFSIDNIGTVPVMLADGSPSFTLPAGWTTTSAGTNSVYLVDGSSVQEIQVTWSFTDVTGAPFTATSLCPGGIVYVHYSICFFEGLAQKQNYLFQSTWCFENCEPAS